MILSYGELALSVINGLPAEYKTLRTVITATENRLNLDELQPKLLVVENENGKPVPESNTYMARPGNGQTSLEEASRLIRPETEGDSQACLDWASQERLLEA